MSDATQFSNRKVAFFLFPECLIISILCTDQSISMKFVLASLLCILSPVILFSQDKNLQLLEELDQAISHKKQYEEINNRKIDKLREDHEKINLKKDINRFEVLKDLHQAYFTFDYDSAINIAFEMLEIAQELNNPSLISESRLRISETLLASGIFNEAKEEISKIRVNDLRDSMKIEHYYTYSRIFFDMADNYQKSFYAEKYNRLGLNYLDSAIFLVDTATISFYSFRGLRYVRTRDMKNAAINYKYLFEHFRPEGRQYAIDASTYGFVLEQSGRFDDGISWLIRAAIQDIKMANKENVALLNLANKLFEKGDIEKSSKYLGVALEDAKKYGALQRKFQIMEIQPIVEAARLNIVETQKNRIKHYAIAVSILSISVLIVLFLLFRQLQKVRAARNEINRSNNALKVINNKLREVNLIKEEYIGFFFKTNSDLIDKLDSYRQSIDNKIAMKRTDELGSLITRKNIKQEREALFSSFDAAFLNIFPDFIQKYNELFRPEDQGVTNNSKQMNTDLRIFALIRLGIMDTEKIAHILNYSVHTIYTYKTKIKNLSLVSNEDFEKEILKIQSI